MKIVGVMIPIGHKKIAIVNGHVDHNQVMSGSHNLLIHGVIWHLFLQVCFVHGVQIHEKYLSQVVVIIIGGVTTITL